MKNRLIVIEGPQGTGKTTLANYLREAIASSNLYRLSGQKEKKQEGKLLSQKMYEALLSYLKNMENIPMDLIFDRSFFTEEVYSRLGYKEYSFTDVYNELLKEFCQLNYEIYIIVLYLKKEELYEQRLQREMHHNYQTFSLENSVNQQNMYLQLAKELKEKNLKVITLEMDQFDTAYQQIKKILKIE